MDTVFVVQHSYPQIDGTDETKLIGVFSTRHQARLAVRRLRRQSGFKETPKDFYIDPYKLDEIKWQEGFIRMLNGRRVRVKRARES